MRPRSSALVCFVLSLLGCGTAELRTSDGGLGDASIDASIDAGHDADTVDASSAPDAGRDAAASDATSTDAASVDASLGSRCMVSDIAVTCTHDTLVLRTGTTTLTDRDVHFQVPLGAPPAEGFPVAILFQGSTLSAERTWFGDAGARYGTFHQARLVALLLDAGYAVITPEAARDGALYYDTNVPAYALSWELAPDHQLMLAIFARIEAGDFGTLDASRMYAAGISSGGYMTSRMAVSYPGRFRALAIQSASYATCAGTYCVVPATLPADHPPTLFLHGERDTIVPISTMFPYATRLDAQGVDTRTVIDPEAEHEWLASSPEDVLAWFSLY